MNINKTNLNCGDTLGEKTLFIEKSTFDINMLSDILIKVTSEFSGRSFVFNEVEVREECGLSYIKTPGYILADVSHYCSSGDYFYRSDFQHFIDMGFFVFFQTKSIDTFKVYDFAKDNSHVECRIEYGERLAFVKDFIDSLIAYKIENNVDNLTSSQIEDIKLDFFSSRFNLIANNYKDLECLDDQELQKIESNYLKEKQKVYAKKNERQIQFNNVASKYKLSN